MKLKIQNPKFKINQKFSRQANQIAGGIPFSSARDMAGQIQKMGFKFCALCLFCLSAVQAGILCFGIWISAYAQEDKEKMGTSTKIDGYQKTIEKLFNDRNERGKVATIEGVKPINGYQRTIEELFNDLNERGRAATLKAVTPRERDGYVETIELLSASKVKKLVAGEPVKEPIIVNGDKLEYSTDKREVIVTGNAEVIYKGMKLTSDKLTLNTQTKDAEAQGRARLDEQRGVIEGTKIVYNFETKTGIIIDSDFRSNPYFGKGETVDKVSENEFIAKRGYMTTCSYDNPHYRMKSRRINFFMQDKVQTRDDVFYLGKYPLLYIPQYNHSLKDPMMHVRLMPGKSKDWGAYLLTAWKYNLTENISGRIYFDYRERLGSSEGFGANYDTHGVGQGNFKYYYTQERSRRFLEGQQAEFQRYFIRWRHKWEIDEMTNFISQYFKIIDSKRRIYGSEYNVLKDYFYREYEKDAAPLTYATFHHSFTYASVDVLMQKRVNRWYGQEEKLPEISYSLPSIQIGDSQLFFENSGSYVNYNSKAAVPSLSWNDVTYNKFDSTNKLSRPTKVAFFNLTPFISGREVFQDKSTYDATLQTVFSTGSDLSTKFYRLFDVKTNFLKLDINGLRHVITPTASYAYTNTSTMPSSKLRFGGGASTASTAITLELSNKLQTKRKGQKVDLADLRINTSYNLRPKSGTKRGSSLSDFVFDLELRPYSWLRIDADTTYNHNTTSRYTDPNFKHIVSANYDINFEFTPERTIGVGQRYQRKGGNELTFEFNWRLNPKWRFSLYQRRNRGHDPALKRGLREQQYIIARDFHCWTVEWTYDIKRGEGESVWLVFRLKAFPELEFEFNQGYHRPKPGSQSNP